MNKTLVLILLGKYGQKQLENKQLVDSYRCEKQFFSKFTRSVLFIEPSVKKQPNLETIEVNRTLVEFFSSGKNFCQICQKIFFSFFLSLKPFSNSKPFTNDFPKPVFIFCFKCGGDIWGKFLKTRFRALLSFLLLKTFAENLRMAENMPVLGGRLVRFC